VSRERGFLSKLSDSTNFLSWCKCTGCFLPNVTVTLVLQLQSKLRLSVPQTNYVRVLQCQLY